jgi:glycosyltransferase involved in cell wall biosynthesis
LFAAIPEGYRVVLIDNGSDDDTAGVARRLGAEVVHEPRRGYGTALLGGIRLLGEDPPDVAVILDADGADPPELMDRLLAPIRHDRADLVLSDRTQHAEPGSLSRTQRYGNRLATRLIAWQTGHRYRDMGPFRAIRWSSLLRLQMSDPTWGWNVEMQMKAIKRGIRVLEIPLPYRRRIRGESKISGSLSGATRAGYRILLAVHRYR